MSRDRADPRPDPGGGVGHRRRACVRAGLAAVGAHRLRHTLACEMVAARCAAGRDRAAAAAPQPGVHRRSTPGWIVDRLTELARPGRHDGRDAVMTALGEHVADYLALRRSLGFKLVHEGQHPAPVRRLPGGRRIVEDHQQSWRSPGRGCRPGCSRSPGRTGLGAVRGFARYLHDDRPGHRDPAARRVRPPRKRPTPYLYSDTDIDRAARRRRRPASAAAGSDLSRRCSGCWPCRACGSAKRSTCAATTSTCADGVVTVSAASSAARRLVPLHPSTTDALRGYAAAARPARARPPPRTRSSSPPAAPR